MYRADLAWIHHDGFTRFIRERAPTLLKQLPRKGFVVDLGTGSGVWAKTLTARGHRVLGIDAAPAMVKLARRTAPRARFQVGSWVSARIPPCDAVTAISEVLNYASAPLGPLFRRVRQALKPGGVFLFDVASPGRPTGKVFVEGRDWLVCVDRIEQGLKFTRAITTFRRAGRLWRRDDEIHRCTLRPPEAVLAALERAGFSAKVERLGPGHHAFTARR
jgi:SAM-dependent methyltransferase